MTFHLKSGSINTNMWDLAKQLSHWKLSVRNVSLFATVMFVATFVWSVVMPTPVFAEDATWKGDALSYQNKTYTPLTGAAYAQKLQVPAADTSAFSYNNQADKTLEVIYVKKPSPDKAVTDATSGQLVIFKDFNPPDMFSSRSLTPQTVTISKVIGTATNEATEGSSCDSRIFQGLGWILCPVSNVLASAVDNTYDIVTAFLEVTTLTGDQNNSVYKVWQIVVGLANICFIFAFLYIVYVHLTSVNVERYHLFKKSLPRLLIAAILVNVSYWICALGVDISNFLGYSVRQLFLGVYNSIGSDPSINWTTATTAILSAGTIGGIAGFTLAAYAAATSAGYLLIAMLVPVVLAALVAFIILAARQALIVIFIIIAPFAFVAWVLPNTEKYFQKWFKAFMTLLMMFPIFSALFGGSLLAGAAIMNSAKSSPPNMQLIIVLIGMAVQIIPLVLTPIIIRFSTGVLGQIANMTNNRKRGLADRTRNWANANAKHHGLRKRANIARDIEARKNGQLSKYSMRGRGLGRLSYNMDQSRRKREMLDKDNESQIDSRASATYEKAIQSEQSGYFGSPSNKYATARAGRHIAHVDHKMAEEYKGIVSDEGEAHWNKLSREDLAIQALRVNRIDAQEASNVTSEQWNEFIANIQAKGGEAPEVSAANREVADRIRMNRQEVDVVKSAQDAANRITQQNFAKALQDDEIIRLRATGIGDDNAQARVLAKAKSTVSAAMVEDIKNIESTMDYDLAKNTAKLEAMIKGEDGSNLSFAQKVAYTKAMSKNGGPGIESLRKVLKSIDRPGGEKVVAPEQLDDFKELLAAEGSIMSAGKDIEFYLTKSTRNGTDGKPIVNADGSLEYRTFDDLSKDVKTWTNLSASAFASQNATTQHYALAMLHDKDHEAYMQIVNSIRANPSALGSLKQTVYERFSIYSDAQRRSNPDLPEPGTMV